MPVIIQEAIAGTLESSDVLIKIAPATQTGLSIMIESIVIQQFGEAIRRTAEDTLYQLGVTDADVYIDDKGALDCVLKARIQTAVLRASAQNGVPWEQLA